jgi:hypothetical protein
MLANLEFTAVVASDKRLEGKAGLPGSLDEPLSCLWLPLRV